MSGDPWSDLKKLNAQVERGEECRQFIDSKGHQILTALRHMLEFWQVQMDTAGAAVEKEDTPEARQLASLAFDQHNAWFFLLKDAEKVVDGE